MASAPFSSHGGHEALSDPEVRRDAPARAGAGSAAPRWRAEASLPPWRKPPQCRYDARRRREDTRSEYVRQTAPVRSVPDRIVPDRAKVAGGGGAPTERSAPRSPWARAALRGCHRRAPRARWYAPAGKAAWILLSPFLYKGACSAPRGWVRAHRGPPAVPRATCPLRRAVAARQD